MSQLWRGVVVVLGLGVLLGQVGCADSVYTLPPPPPPNKRASVSLVPGEEERRSERDYLKARAAVLKLNQLLASKRYKEALSWMSQETQDMLRYANPKQDAVSALAEGKLVLPDGRTITMEPGALLLAPDLSNMRDSVEGVEEQETSGRRKELFALQKSGPPRKIVMIKEGGRWVLHRTSIPKTSP